MDNTSDANKPVSSATLTALNGKAPTSHRSASATYGLGTSSYYGHVKLSDSTDSTSGAGGGIAATPYAVKAVYDGVNTVIDELSMNLNDLLNEKLAPPTTITVGCTDSSHQWLVDYRCDGSNDASQIQAAINALPSTGGKVVLLEGTYNIKTKITVTKSNVTIEGMGASTKLVNAASVREAIYISSKSYIEICRLNISGFTQTYGSGIYITHTNYSNIHDNIVDNCLNGIFLDNSDYDNQVSSNTINNCTQHGIYLYNNSDRNVISYNNIMNSTVSGIFASWCNNNTVSNNYCRENNNGIDMSGRLCTITNNICADNTTGINVNTTSSLIEGNICYRGTGTTSDYTSSQYTIKVGSGSNNIISNSIMGKNYVNNGGTTNTFANNKYS